MMARSADRPAIASAGVEGLLTSGAHSLQTVDDERGGAPTADSSLRWLPGVARLVWRVPSFVALVALVAFGVLRLPGSDSSDVAVLVVCAPARLMAPLSVTAMGPASAAAPAGTWRRGGS